MMGYMDYLVTILSRCVPHVEILTLSTTVSVGKGIKGLSTRFNNLKQPVMVIPDIDEIGLLSFGSLINASPCLEKLVPTRGDSFAPNSLQLKEHMDKPHLT